MAQAQARARFVTEVAPQQAVSIMRRRKQARRSLLDPIAEDEREHQLAYGPEHHHHYQTLNASGGFAAARTKSAPLPQEGGERAGRLMRELSEYFSDVRSDQAGGSWEQSSRQGRRRAVCA